MVVKLRGSDSVWKSVKSIKLRDSNASWANVVKGYIRDSLGSWRLFFLSALTPKIDTDVTLDTTQNNTTKLLTLVGTNYHWQNSTGLQYQFQYSTDNVSYYDLTSLATTTNPTISNTETLLLQNSMVTPDVTNYFLFAVTGTNSTYNTTSTSSAIITVEGVRNLTVTKDLEDYTSISFSWTGGLYSNGYIYQYQTYDNNIGGGWSSSVYTTSPYATITGLTSGGKVYQIRVKGVTGTSTTNPGYSGNWAYQTGTTISAPAPIVTYYPSISGTGLALTNVTPTTGGYTNYTSKQTAIIAIYAGQITLTQGESSLPSGVVLTTPWSTSSPSSHTVTQSDATTPVYTFYTVDKILGVDGQTLFYYYSQSGLAADIGIVEDNYGRTVSSGSILGLMSSGFVYSGYNSGSAWAVNSGSAENTNTTSASSSPTGWPKQTVETSGNPDVGVTIKFPTSDGGLGIAFWVTSAGSWWAATSYKNEVTIPGISCTGTVHTGTTCPQLGTNEGDYCNCVTITIPASDPACTVSLTNQSSLATIGTAAGDRCSSYTTNVTHSYTCTKSLTGQADRGTEATGYPRTYTSSDVNKRCTNSTSYTTYACDGYVGGAPNAGSLATLPYISSDVGSRCSAATSSTDYYCTGSKTNQSSAGSYASAPYTSSSVGVRCTDYTTNPAYTTYECNTSVTGRSSAGSLASGPYSSADVGKRCSSATLVPGSTTYSCSGSVTGASSVGTTASTPYGASDVGKRCGSYTTHAAYTTYECVGSVTGQASCGGTASTPYTASSVGLRCGTCNGTKGNYYYDVVASVYHPATYDYSTVTSSTTSDTYNYDVVGSVSHPATYDYTVVEKYVTYSYNTVTSTTTYDYSVVEDITTTTYDYSVNDSGTQASTGKQWSTQVSGNTPHYNTYIKIYSANGSSITEQDSLLVDSNTTAYATVWGMSVYTIGDTVYSSLYSDSSLSTRIGDRFQKTYSSPTKTGLDGSTAAGIIKGYSPIGQGSRFDDLWLSS